MCLDASTQKALQPVVLGKLSALLASHATSHLCDFAGEARCDHCRRTGAAASMGHQRHDVAEHARPRVKPSSLQLLMQLCCGVSQRSPLMFCHSPGVGKLAAGRDMFPHSSRPGEPPKHSMLGLASFSRHQHRLGAPSCATSCREKRNVEVSVRLLALGCLFEPFFLHFFLDSR